MDTTENKDRNINKTFLSVRKNGYCAGVETNKSDILEAISMDGWSCSYVVRFNPRNGSSNNTEQRRNQKLTLKTVFINTG